LLRVSESVRELSLGEPNMSFQQHYYWGKL